MLLVHLDQPSPRAHYIARHLFERMLGWPITFTASLEEFRSANGPKLNYGAIAIDGAFHVPCSGWLDTASIHALEPPHTGDGESLRIFPIGESHDVFAAAFFFLCLIEEYTITARDAHDRVPADGLFIVRKGAESFPLVDRWVLELARTMRERFPELTDPKRTYRHVLTVDVDNGLKYAGRSLFRAIGASAKDLLRGDASALRERWNVRGGGSRDPYAAFADRITEVQSQVDRVITFFLLKGGGVFDHAADVEHPAYRQLLQNVARSAEIALHPSYESSRSSGHIAEERDRLRSIIQREITASRQHFLRWKLPSTLRSLIDLGFTEEHSLGFSDRSGFHAGTCTPFPWYDLEREEETKFMLWPFAVMDSALRDPGSKAGMTGAELHEALREMMRMSDIVREVNGTFVSVWHDRYLSGHGEFKGGPEAMMELVQHARA